MIELGVGQDAILRQLRPVWLKIEADVVPMVRGKVKWRRFRYDELAKLTRCDESHWRYPGRYRMAITGGNGRSHLRRHYRLWWASDDEFHAGILFTADCRVGIEWDRRRILARVQRDASYLTDAANGAATLQPTFRDYFRKIAEGAERLTAGSARLAILGAARLKALGITDFGNNTEGHG